MKYQHIQHNPSAEFLCFTSRRSPASRAKYAFLLITRLRNFPWKTSPYHLLDGERHIGVNDDRQSGRSLNHIFLLVGIPVWIARLSFRLGGFLWEGRTSRRELFSNVLSLALWSGVGMRIRNKYIEANKS